MKNFLLSQEKEVLRKALRVERVKEKEDRIKTILLLNVGWSYDQLALTLSIDKEAVVRYQKEYQAMGINKFLDKNYSGRPLKLAEKIKVINKGSKLKVYEENIPLSDKIKLVKEKEITRLKDVREKAENSNNNNENHLIESFSKIRPALNELKQACSNNKGVNVKIHKFSAYISLDGDSGKTEGEIFIEPSNSTEGFCVSGNIMGYNSIVFNSVEESIDYIVGLMGQYLAEKES